jgi:hypothetical protein
MATRGVTNLVPSRVTSFELPELFDVTFAGEQWWRCVKQDKSIKFTNQRHTAVSVCSIARDPRVTAAQLMRIPHQCACMSR